MSAVGLIYSPYPGNLGLWDLSDFLFVSAFSSRSIDRITRLLCRAALQMGFVCALALYQYTDLGALYLNSY